MPVILLLATGEVGAGRCVKSLGPLTTGDCPPSRSPVRGISLVRFQLLKMFPRLVLAKLLFSSLVGSGGDIILQSSVTVRVAT